MAGMMQEARQQAEAETPPPLSQRQQIEARLDLLQAQISTLQSQINQVQQQCQQLAQQQLQVMQRQEEQRALLMKIGQLLTQVNKQTRKEKKSWMPWIS